MSSVVFQSAPVGADTENTNPNDTSGSGDIDLGPGEIEVISFDITNSASGDSNTFSIASAPAFGTLTVTDANTGLFSYTVTEAQWLAAGSPASVTMSFSDDSGALNNASYTLNITCFAPGTMIATPTGEQEVETLEIGDLIRTADGRDVAVKWLGVQTISTIFGGNTERLRPVRIAKGALGSDLPHSDLTVTADHGMVMDDLVINASALVNGSSIAFAPLSELGERFTVYHIETEDHDVILANGAPAETYVDANSRATFDNFQEYVDLYGSESEVREMDLPRVVTSRLVPADIRARINAATTSVEMRASA